MTHEALRHTGPLLLVALPLLVAAGFAALALLPRVRFPEGLRHGVVAATALVTGVGVLALVPGVLAAGSVEASVPALLGELRFRLDGVSALLALLASLVWCCSSLHAAAYFRGDPPAAALRYHVTSLVSFAAMLMVLLAADMVTMYLGFDWLGLSAYLFVIHTGSPQARSAGVKYLVLTLMGSFSVLAGVLLVYAMGGGDLAVGLPPEAAGGMRLAAAACLLLGFGVKAGALGVHTWLPDAHSSAPAPASAVLSGVMIKAGAYGIVRTLGSLFQTEVDGLAAALLQVETLGLIVLWWGIATMLAGVVMALWQHQAKRLLAYSSVSQMGFILAGVGAATYLGEGGGIGWAGSLLHVVNHGLFKGLLFLGVGAVIVAAGSGDLRKLGGLARRMPWTFAFMLVGVAGIAGLPLLNGFVSKSVIHHALEYAMAQAQAGAQPHGLVLAERLYTLTTVGTAAALVKLLALTFLGSPRATLERAPLEAPIAMRAAMAALAAGVVLLGLWPQVTAPLLSAALDGWGLPSGGVTGWLAGPIRHAGDLSGAMGALAVGTVVHLIAARTGLYARALPVWLSLDWVAAALYRVTQRATLALREAFDAARARRLARRERAERARAARHARAARRRAGGAGRAIADTPHARMGTSVEPAPRVHERVLQRLGYPVGQVLVEAARRWSAPGPPAPPRRPVGQVLVAAARRGRRRLVVRWWRLERASDQFVRSLVRTLRRGAARLDASWRLAREIGVGRVDEDEREQLVLETRSRIQRHNRDVGLSVAVLVAVWLLVLASLSLAAP